MPSLTPEFDSERQLDRIERQLDNIERLLLKMLRPTFVWQPGSVSNVVPAERVVRATKATLRQALLAALGEEMTHEKRLEEEPSLERELSWRRGWNAKRESMLEAINRLLPEEG